MIMVKPFFVGGEAGAGKTRRLMEEAALYGGRLISKPHQRALVMAVMHGARRQLHSTLSRFCPALPVTVSTVHSFALRVVNRWRRSLGLTAPVTICDTSCCLAEQHERTQATFDEVIHLACELLESATVKKTLAESYPLVIVDEFQDCVGSTLQFVQALGDSTKLLLGADHFQLLGDEVEGCPAVDWIQRLRGEGNVEYVELAGCHRTNAPAILQAARALRDNVKATQCTVPVYYGYQPAQVAYRMCERFTGWRGVKQIGDGTCALVALSVDDVQLHKLLESFGRQLERKNSRRVNWSQGASEGQLQNELIAELGLNSDGIPGTEWSAKHLALSGRALEVAEDVARFSKLRGISTIPHELVRQFAKLAVHNARAFARTSPRCQVLTVHGAKNREFDHVFVFWGYKNSGWSIEQQRRLLYNAVTRAKIDCTVLVLGDLKRTQGDPAVSLLGPAQPAIDPAWKKRTLTKPKAPRRPANSS
jgi:superfamily I DNA/RNA helicase